MLARASFLGRDGSRYSARRQTAQRPRARQQSCLWSSSFDRHPAVWESGRESGRGRSLAVCGGRIVGGAWAHSRSCVVHGTRSGGGLPRWTYGLITATSGDGGAGCAILGRRFGQQSDKNSLRVATLRVGKRKIHLAVDLEHYSRILAKNGLFVTSTLRETHCSSKLSRPSLPATITVRKPFAVTTR